MARHALVPPELTTAPFTLEQARRAGLARWHLETSAYQRLGPKLYAWSGLGDAPSLKLAAARCRLPSGCVFSGLTATWLHGLETELCDPIDVTIESTAGISRRTGIRIRRSALDRRDVTSKAGFRTTTVERTLADLSIDSDLTEVVVLADAATHRGLTTIRNLTAYADRSGGRVGIAAFRRMIDLTEPKTESQMESRLRMLLVDAGLPRPHSQVPLYDRHGDFIGRPDLYYPGQKLGIEYDGGIHKQTLVEDNRRQNRLLGEGIHLLRFTASDVFKDPEKVADQVRIMLERLAGNGPRVSKAAV